MRPLALQLRRCASPGFALSRPCRAAAHHRFSAVKPTPKKIVSASGVACATTGIRVRQMAEYRLYCLDGDSKVASGDWIEANDDQAAIEVAKNTHDGYEC